MLDFENKVCNIRPPKTTCDYPLHVFVRKSKNLAIANKTDITFETILCFSMLYQTLKLTFRDQRGLALDFKELCPSVGTPWACFGFTEVPNVLSVKIAVSY